MSHVTYILKKYDFKYNNGKNMNSRWDKRLDIVENSFKRYSDRRKKNIHKSLIRPLYQEILKSIFFILTLVINSFILLEILIFFIFPTNMIIILIIIFILLYFEIKVYNSYWGVNGKWSLDNYKKKEDN